MKDTDVFEEGKSYSAVYMFRLPENSEKRFASAVTVK